MSSKERHMMTTTNQLELGFNGTQSRIYGRRRERRVARAKWWFDKMRATVENAWQQQAQPRPEQIIFAGVNRGVEV
jgi:hypothetical protein